MLRAHGQNTMSVGQHMFGAGTGSDAMNDWYRYLGPPTTQVQPSPYDRQQYTNYDLPEAYKGKNLFLRDTIDGFILEDYEWYTTVALPWTFSDQQHVQMNLWEFNAQLAGRVPHEGISRLITSSKRQFRDHVVRRGLAFIMEADYLGTAEGDFQYTQNIAQISQSVQETQNHDTVVALLSCKNYHRHWMEHFGQAGFSWEKILEEEILNFASIQRDEKRVDIVFEHHKRLMAKVGTKPNLLIAPPGFKIYLSMVPPAKTAYYVAGPDGVAQFREGPTSVATFRPGTSDAVDVFETRDFDVYHDEPPIQLLTRPIQVSENYGMLFGEWRNDDIYDYQSRHRDIVLWDENLDNYAKISFRTAFRNSNMFERDGPYHKYLQTMVSNYKSREATVKNNPMDDDDDDDDDDDYDGDGTAWRHGKTGFRPHFLTAPNDDGVYELIEYWGQMDRNAADIEDFRQVAQTIVGCVFPNGADDEHRIWQDMIELINQIENQPYSHEYFRRLIEANEAYSLDANGNFVGEKTPAAAAGGWGQRMRLREWTPNASGSLNLPDGSGLDVDFPAGFANGPGLRTIAKEAQKPGSAWKALGQRVESIMNMLNRFVSTMRNIFPSGVLSEENMPPWFHRPDALTTFFANVISINRDPVWLAALPPVTDSDGNVEGRTFGRSAAASDDKIAWYPVPMFVLDASDETIQSLRGIYDGEVPGDVVTAAGRSSGAPDDAAVFIFNSPVTGKAVRVPARYLQSPTMLPKEIRAALLMGPETTPMLQTIFAGLDDSSKNKLLSFMYVYSGTKTFNVDNLRKIVRGINASANPADVIDTIFVDKTSTPAKKKAAKKKIDDILAAYDKLDPEGELGATPRGIEPPAAISNWAGSAPSAKSSISFSQLREDVDRMFEIRTTIEGIRAAYPPAAAPGDFGLGVDAVTSYLSPGPPPATPAAVAENFTALAAELTGLAANADGRLREVFGTGREEEEAAWRTQATTRREGRRKKFTVQDDEDAGVRATFYRSPLTMSLGLLESLATHGPGAFVRPSDPASGHLRPYVETGDFEDEGKTVLDEALWQRPQYAGISSLIKNSDARKLEHTTPLVRLAVGAGAPSFGGRNSPEMSDDNDMDIDDTSEVDAFEQAFGGGVPIGAQFGGGFQQPDTWTKGALRSGSSKYDARSPGSEYYQMLSDTFVYRWSQANEETNPLLRAAMHMFMLSKCNHEKYWLKMIDNNIHVLVNLMLWRLQIDHDMSTLILMKGGLETGANVFGHSNFVTSNDGVSKIIYGNYTFNSKAMVWKERNVHLIENVKAEGYNGGNNTKFAKFKKFEISMADQNVNKPSIIVTAMGIKENSFPKYMQFTPALTPGWINTAIDGVPRSLYSSAEYYEMLWQVARVSQKGDRGQDDFFDRPDRFPNVSLQGFQMNYNRRSARYNRVIEAQGHMGKNGSYPGAAMVWKGNDLFFEKDPRHTDVIIE